jgi:hypothetical protein
MESMFQSVCVMPRASTPSAHFRSAVSLFEVQQRQRKCRLCFHWTNRVGFVRPKCRYRTHI